MKTFNYINFERVLWNFRKSIRFFQNNNQNSFYFITSFPKSASSFIELVLKDLIKCKGVSLSYSFLREQDLDYPKLVKFQDAEIITKQHTLGTTPNVELMRDFNISPVILTRRLPNVLVSLRHHILRTLKWPFFQVPQKFTDMSIDDQYDFLIDMAIPWYIFFYVSWKEVEQKGLVKTNFVTYDEFIDDKVNFIREILTYWGLSFSDRQIMDSIKSVYRMDANLTRNNNRTDVEYSHELSHFNVSKIIEFTRYYPDIDFSDIL